MEKNWLIRTSSKQILGPITRKKVIELIEKKSLKSNDEICSGCGFWFFLKERELVERYVYQNEKQVFNPISEATCVITKSEKDVSNEKDSQTNSTKVINIEDIRSQKEVSETSEGSVSPSAEDLEYPDIDVSLSSDDDLSDVEDHKLDMEKKK